MDTQATNHNVSTYRAIKALPTKTTLQTVPTATTKKLSNIPISKIFYPLYPTPFSATVVLLQGTTIV